MSPPHRQRDTCPRVEGMLFPSHSPPSFPSFLLPSFSHKVSFFLSYLLHPCLPFFLHFFFPLPSPSPAQEEENPLSSSFLSDWHWHRSAHSSPCIGMVAGRQVVAWWHGKVGLLPSFFLPSSCLFSSSIGRKEKRLFGKRQKPPPPVGFSVFLPPFRFLFFVSPFVEFCRFVFLKAPVCSVGGRSARSPVQEPSVFHAPLCAPPLSPSIYPRRLTTTEKRIGRFLFPASSVLFFFQYKTDIDHHHTAHDAHHQSTTPV